jgi:hypothetical protein
MPKYITDGGIDRAAHFPVDRIAEHALPVTDAQDVK